MGQTSKVLRLDNVRLAFCQNLFEKGTVGVEDKNPAYSSNFLIQKDDPQINTIVEAINYIAQQMWGPKAEGYLATMWQQSRVCLKDGDTKPDYDGFPGAYFISARNSEQKPKVFDKDRTEILDKSVGRPYAGCYVNGSVELWCQDNAFGKRINARLRAVQFASDGDAFAGSAPASAEEFPDLSDQGDAAAGLF